MRSEDEIIKYKNKIEQELALKIARACVGYRENVKATIKDLRGQLKALDYVLQEDNQMSSEKEIKALLNTGKWAYTIVGKEIYFKYLGNKDKTNLGYLIHFDWPEPKEILE